MIPITQTKMHAPEDGVHGDCMSAVLASLLHLPIESVPMFTDPITWVKDLNAWLLQFGLAYFMFENLDCEVEAYGVSGMWHEISGNTSRFADVQHACVARDCKVNFDPHPSRSGLTRIACHGVFIALEPWRVAAAYMAEPKKGEADV